MDVESIRAEVARLAPWYYAFDLRGVRTDALPPCDAHGHRRLLIPEIADGFWRGKTVLDAGCAEGMWTFAALGHGAAAVTAFDCRAIHVEKSRFVARVLGQERAAEFHVGSADTWPDEHPQPHDIVLLCGLLYHLPEPWRTIPRYCALARESIVVTSTLWDCRGEDGYTLWSEQDDIAASEDSADSRMPNTTATLLAEFARSGFEPVHVQETPDGPFDGGCMLVLRNCTGWRREVEYRERDGEIDVWFAPARGELGVSLFSRSDAAREATGRLVVCGAAGELARHEDVALRFLSRTRSGRSYSSPSLDFRIPLPPGSAPWRAELELFAADGALLPRVTAELSSQAGR